MKKVIAGPLFEAVNGLWSSGLYGLLAGSLAGIVCGAAAGAATGLVVSFWNFSLPFLLLALFCGAIYGVCIGVIVGALVGLPAGVFASGLGGRQGCRVGTALAAFGIGSGVALVYYLPSLRTGQNVLGNASYFPLILLLCLLVFTLVSYWVGNYMYNRLENSNGLFTRWRLTLHHCGIEELSREDRKISLAIAIAPILFTYGYGLVSVVLGMLQ